MAAIEKESGYQSLERRDLDSDSDTTACENGQSARFLDGKLSKGPRRKSRKSRTILTWARWGVVVGLQTVILLVLLLKGQDPDEVETGGDINGLFKTSMSDPLRGNHS
jgi:hypothetical protein